MTSRSKKRAVGIAIALAAAAIVVGLMLAKGDGPAGSSGPEDAHDSGVPIQTLPSQSDADSASAPSARTPPSMGRSALIS